MSQPLTFPTALASPVAAALMAEECGSGRRDPPPAGVEVVLINQISHYIISAGGKRIRPMLVLFFSGALGFAAASASSWRPSSSSSTPRPCCTTTWSTNRLLRRGRDTANALFGNAASVLVGDFLYSRAFQMMVSVNRMRVLEVLAEATNVIAEGEVLQLMNMHDPDCRSKKYLRVMRFKTAKLFEASLPGRRHVGRADRRPRRPGQYGRLLGTAFQLSTTCWTTPAKSRTRQKCRRRHGAKASRHCPYRDGAGTPGSELRPRAIEHGGGGPVSVVVAIVRIDRRAFDLRARASRRIAIGKACAEQRGQLAVSTIPFTAISATIMRFRTVERVLRLSGSASRERGVA